MKIKDEKQTEVLPSVSQTTVYCLNSEHAAGHLKLKAVIAWSGYLINWTLSSVYKFHGVMFIKTEVA